MKRQRPLLQVEGLEDRCCPAMLTYGTYLGDGGGDRGLGIAVDSASNVYITGQTTTASNGVDAFVMKLNAAGTMEYFVFLGGPGFDAGFDIAVDASGNAYVVGAAQAGFPVLLGLDPTHNGGFDAFIAKLDSTGALVYSGFIGGAGIDFAEGIALDSAGNAYVTGPTNSTQVSFPVTVGPDVTQNGSYDTFVAKVNAAGSALVYCGYIGGSLDDVGNTGGVITSGHIAVDGAGNAYISGMTKSTEGTFPDGDGFGSLPGADQTHNGRYDAYVAKVNAAGTGLVYATYIGGRGFDQGFGMAVDSAGNAYITGNTDSSEASFPVTVGPDLTYNRGIDAFVAKLDSTGTALLYAGYVGGSRLDQGLGLALDASGNVYVIGHTRSSEATFPAFGGPDSTFNSGRKSGDAFVAQVLPGGTLGFAGYIGGSGQDAAFWIALDGAGNAYIVGDTDSTQATFPDGDGFGTLPGNDQTYNGGGDGFVVKMDIDGVGPSSLGGGSEGDSDGGDLVFNALSLAGFPFEGFSGVGQPTADFAPLLSAGSAAFLLEDEDLAPAAAPASSPLAKFAPPPTEQDLDISVVDRFFAATVAKRPKLTHFWAIPTDDFFSDLDSAEVLLARKGDATRFA